MPVEPWVSLAEVAKHLDVHVETGRRWALGSAIPATKIGKVWRFKLSEVDAWAKSGQPHTRPPSTI